ncbi:hypothetical protein GA0116948_103156 [Chitinophaga costaii]|uniref:Uncharacterized protein n=2 Tax=Chitinophaga costaii TaxID=1335309 RepID=A0A1C4BLB6_9BACT|nr:hypothetical protein GA0116948_103156 [Chitinophaga costaii]
MLDYIITACANNQTNFGIEIVKKGTRPISQNTLSNALRKGRDKLTARIYFGTKNRFGIDLEACNEFNKIIVVVDPRKLTSKAAAFLKQKGYHFLFAITTYKPDTGSITFPTYEMAAESSTESEMVVEDEQAFQPGRYITLGATYNLLPLADFEENKFYFIVLKTKQAIPGFARRSINKNAFHLTDKQGHTLLNIKPDDIAALYLDPTS